jgi:hypothetical protein
LLADVLLRAVDLEIFGLVQVMSMQQATIGLLVGFGLNCRPTSVPSPITQKASRSA